MSEQKKEEKKQKNNPELIYDKRGYLVYMTKDGKLVRGLRRRHFQAKVNTKETISQFYVYLSEVYKQKADDSLNEKTPKEKLAEKIAALQKKHDTM